MDAGSRSSKKKPPTGADKRKTAKKRKLVDSAKDTVSICKFFTGYPMVADVQDQDTTATAPASSSVEGQDQDDEDDVVSRASSDPDQQQEDQVSASSTLVGQDSYSAEHTSSPLQSVHKEDRITTKSTEIQDEAIRFHRLGDGAPICKRLHNVKFNANQPRFEDVVTLPFDPKKVYERRISDKYIHRQWVTVKVTDRTVMGVYCNVCLAFAHSDSAFTNGFTTYSHIYQRISEHESSKSHNVAVTALFHAQSGTDIETYVNKNMMDARKREVLTNVEVLKRILAVVKFLGKQALPYRGHRNESAYSLEDQTVDHGNFLELILLIAEFDVPLNLHVKKIIETSKRRQEKLKREGKEKSRGRGGLSTMLSKTTVNKILVGICCIMQKKIVDKIGEQQFSVQKSRYISN